MSSTTLLDSESLPSEAARFCADHNTYFDNLPYDAQSIPRPVLEALHLGALKLKFETLVNEIPMLRKLAEKQGIHTINSLQDVVPLLFEHTMYKSYPPVLLEKNRFGDINKFISRLTTYDLSAIDVSNCKSIDEWLSVMDRDSELRICHSSGTTGTMSFMPTSYREWDKYGRAVATIARDCLDDFESELYCIYPYFRDGASTLLRMNDVTVKYIARDEEHFLAAYPERMSSDVLYLAARIRAAKAKGELDRLHVNDNLLQRFKEFEALQNNMPAHLDDFFDRTMHELRGKRVHLAGTWNLLHDLAKKGLERGEEAVFAPDSVIISGGGAKGMTPPEHWQDDVCRFMGVERIRMGYAMTEVQVSHMQCEHGRYHFSPGAIPFLLDPDTSELLPRKGRVTGRAAFFDLTAETRWGGFITGDEITVDWDTPCSCGRQSYYIEGNIERYSEQRGGDDKISCAATEEAHSEAMDFLTQFE